jgi:hypothetical protein
MKRIVGPVFCTLRASFDKPYSNDFMNARTLFFRMGILTLVGSIQILVAIRVRATTPIAANTMTTG